MIPEHLVFIDLETTGANSLRDRITEIGVCETYDGKLVDEWSSLINPETHIPEFIETLTGISTAMVTEAPRFSEIAEELRTRLSGKLLVAHNARFDYGFLKSEFRRQNIDFNEKTLCTVKLSRALYPEQKKHNLDALILRHNLTVNARHRALGDAQIVREFFKKVSSEKPLDLLTRAIQAQLKQPGLPPHLPPEQVANLPSSPGVYFFYGENEVPLYIGKSVDIRTRVHSHFSGGYQARKGTQISQQIRRIDWISTAGELGALLMEARLIKELAPIHNRRLRRTRDLSSIRFKSGRESTQSLEIVSMNRFSGKDLDHLFGTFRTRRLAEKALRELIATQGLCNKVLGVETVKGACFNYQIKKCRGACVGEEPLALHNTRLLAALAKLKLRSWPFPGPVGIKEVSPLQDLTEIHVIDHWCHLGTADNDQRLWDILSERSPLTFDLDSYKLLVRFLDKKSKKVEFIDFSKPHPTLFR